MTSRSRRSIVAATVAAIALAVGLSSTATANITCNDGTYNYRQAATGACAWGNITYAGRSIVWNVVLVDNSAADGVCARLEVQARGTFTTNTIKYYACGYGASTPAQNRGGPLGIGDTGRYFRVCAVGTSCTSWRYYPYG